MFLILGLSRIGPEIDQAAEGSFLLLDPEYFTRQQLTGKSVASLWV